MNRCLSSFLYMSCKSKLFTSLLHLFIGWEASVLKINLIFFIRCVATNYNFSALHLNTSHRVILNSGCTDIPVRDCLKRLRITLHPGEVASDKDICGFCYSLYYLRIAFSQIILTSGALSLCHHSKFPS